MVDDKIIASIKKIYLLGVICKVSDRETSRGTFYFVEKRFESIFKFSASSNFLIFFLRAADWPANNCCRWVPCFLVSRPFRSRDELFLVVRSYSIYEVTTF